MKTIRTLLFTCALTFFSWQGFAQKTAITSIEIAGRGVASQVSFNDSDPLTLLGGGIFVWEGNLNYSNPNASTGSQGFKFVVNYHLQTGDSDWNGKMTLTASNDNFEVSESGGSYAATYAIHDGGHDFKWRLKQGEDGFYRVIINASDLSNVVMTLEKDPEPLAMNYLLYRGTLLPTAQDWIEQKLDETVNDLAAPTTLTTESGALKFASTNAVDQFSQLSWYKTGLDFSLSQGYTVEIKAKVTAADKTGAFNIQGFDKTGKGFRVGILANALTELTNPFAATNVLASDLTNGDTFHVYRFVVASSGEVTTYRDGVLVGTFPLTAFQFDNIIENGGFEDEEFPDFLSNGILRRVSDPKKKLFGNYALEVDNNGLVTDGWSNTESARTREIAVKPDTKYELYVTRRRADSEPWCWRDLGAFYDFQKGTLGLKGENVDARDQRVTWGGFDRYWQTHPQDFTTPENAKTVRFEFPTWYRDGSKNQNIAYFENLTLREKPVVAVTPTYAEPVSFQDPVIPVGITNLITNGGFEDHEMNNDGTPYLWELSDPGRNDGNDPYADNPLWNTGKVRIQRSSQNNDFEPGDRDGQNWAHSGTSSLRFTTDWNNSAARDDKNFDFTVELEANKTYRFVFWTRSPRWPDNGWLFVRLGEGNPIWGHLLNGRNNVWTPVDLTFTTTDENKTLHLYSGHHGDWWNLYLDDMVLYEIPEETPLDPVIEGKTNLIANGDFEDITMNNDGTPYDWALASSNASNDHNFPMAYNEMWGTWLRLQDKEKRGNDSWGDRDDTGYDWAHSGTRSLRFTFLDNWDEARDFEGLTGGELPAAYRLNMNFKKELEPNKTYTFVFWIKTSCWNDRGRFHIANDDIKIMSLELTNKYMNWTRQSVTFSTTSYNHTLRVFTEFGGWMNFYLDDLFLFEEDSYRPELVPELSGNTYLAFGKSTGTSSTDVEVEYVKVFNGGAYAPGAELLTNVIFHQNGGTNAINGIYDTGIAVTLPASEKTGYSFLGWYENRELDGDVVAEIPAGSVGNKEFWAKWEVINYSITYHLNGGEGAKDSSYTIESAAIVLPAPEKAGYNFLGWFNNSELNGDAVAEIPTGSVGEKEFWAKWEIKSGIGAVDTSMRLYPNPVTTGTLTIEGIRSADGNIEVYNVLGILAGVYDITGSKTVINISTLPSGTYIVKVGDQTTRIVKK